MPRGKRYERRKAEGNSQDGSGYDMVNRILAVFGGSILILAGIFSAPTGSERVAHAVFSAGALLGALVSWIVYRGRDEPLTWKPLAGASAVGSGLAGIFVGQFAAGLGAGLVIGLVLAGLVRWGTHELRGRSGPPLESEWRRDATLKNED